MLSMDYKGQVKVSSPYDSIIDEKKEYRVVTIRPIYDLIATKENPLKRVYTDLGRSEEDMLNDIKNKINIVVLNDSAGNYGYIPENHIEPADEQIGVRYQEKTLGINLGYFKTDYDFTLFRNELKEFVKDRLGVETKDKLLESSSVVYLPEDKSEEIESERRHNKSTNIYTRYDQTIERIKHLESMIIKLNGAAIKNIENDIIKNAENGMYLLNTDLKVSYLDKIDNIELDFSLKFGIEYLPNRYMIVTSNNILIDFEFSNSYIIIKNNIELSNEINSIYNTDSGICVFYKKDTDIKLDLYDYDLNLIKSETLVSDIEITNEALMINNFDNSFTIGFTDDDNKAYVNFVTVDNGDILTDVHKIVGLHVSETPLDDNCLFNFTLFDNYGLLIYKTFDKKIVVSNETSLSVDDDNFKPLYLKRNINLFKTVHQNIYNLISHEENKIRFDSMNEDNEILNTTYLENFTLDKSGIILTLDRSLLVLYKKTYKVLEIKKIY